MTGLGEKSNLLPLSATSGIAAESKISIVDIHPTVGQRASSERNNLSNPGAFFICL